MYYILYKLYVLYSTSIHKVFVIYYLQNMYIYISSVFVFLENYLVIPRINFYCINS